MPILRLFTQYMKDGRKRRRSLLLISMMLLFWSLYEGTVSYMTPLAITNNGFSETMMGIIIGTSSVAGALFDLIICHLFKNTYYKRIFMIMFAICATYPLIIFNVNTFAWYILAMALWGIYYDLKSIGIYDFVGRHTDQAAHVSSFGVIQAVQSVGFLIAPILAGFLLADSFNFRPLIMAWIFLGMSITFFIALYFLKDGHNRLEINFEWRRKRTVGAFLVLWGELGRILFPVLLSIFALNIIDAFFWTIGPIFAESLAGIHGFAGFFMTAYSLPSLLVGWIVGYFARIIGKKRTAFISMFIGSLLLGLLYFISQPVMIILDVFLSSVFISMAWPALSGAFADYVSETAKYEKEINGLEDFLANLGYVVGPILAGMTAETIGGSLSFSILGLSGALVAILLLIFSPAQINVRKRLREIRR